MSDQTVHIDRLIERIQLRLDALGLSERKASLIATGRPDAIRYIRTRRASPSAARLMGLAAALQTTAPYLLGHSDDAEEEPSVTSVINSMTDRALNDLEIISKEENSNPIIIRDVIPAGYTLFDAPNNDKKAVNLYSLGSAILGLVPKPKVLPNVASMAFKMPDSTMVPVYDAGSVIYSQISKKIDFKDDLIIGITKEDGSLTENFLIGRLVNRWGDSIEIRQLGTGSSFMVPVDRIQVFYRVLRVSDLILPISSEAEMPHSG